MSFEYDSGKSAANKDRHGIDFEEAQALWKDPAQVEMPARLSDEPRWLVIGMIGVKYWSAIFTRRNGNIRLISVRRSRQTEVDIYEGESETKSEGSDL